jgi:hypothetical protein
MADADCHITADTNVAITVAVMIAMLDRDTRSARANADAHIVSERRGGYSHANCSQNSNSNCAHVKPPVLCRT